MMRITRRFVALLVFFACAATANAQSYTYSVYIDADTNAATGCSVSFSGGTLAGIESVLAVTVAAGTPPTVSSATRSSCSGGSFGAPVAEGTAAVNVGAGVGGTTSIEISDALINVASPSATALRLYAVAQSAAGSDVLLTTTGAAGGQAIVLPLQAGPSAAVPAPLFGIPALLLLGAVLLAFGSRAVRKRMLKRLMLGLVLLSGVAGAAMIFNWNGIGPLATDPAGDSSSGESAIDLRYLFGAFSGNNVFFRFDVNSNLAPPPPKPVAVADTYNDTINTPLNVAAPGVLANDTLNGGTITGNTNPAHGTLALNANGGFVYTPTTGFTGQDSFTYTLTNAGGNSTAIVNIVVLNGPAAQPDSYTTNVGAALNVAAPGVLGNDNLGNPTATLQSFGGGSLNGTVTTNAPGTSVALGTSGGTLTLNANGSLNLTAPTTAGTYTFLYRIGNVQGTSDGTVTIQVNQAPTITSVGPANFSVGANGTYTITTTGTPTVTSITLTGCTLPTGLSFSYVSGATATISGSATAGGTVSCTVTASNGVSPNATQTLVVNATAGPVANADSYSTNVGTALNVSPPGVLGNDNLGSPAATLTKFGGGSLGGVVTDNNAGASVALTGSGGTLTLNANGSINLTAPTTAGTYTFLYRIGNVQGTSDGTVTIQVNQAPTITSVGPANFSVGTNATYNITTTGTPTVTSITLTGCVLPAGLSFNYTSGANATISGTATATGTVVCTVTASNGITPQATQSLTVNANAGPAAIADNYATTVGTALNIAAPGVLGNDTLGFPAATLTKFGGGSLGGVVTDNNAGASVALTGSGGTLTVNANGSIALTAPTTAGTYTFLYRITNSQGSSDGAVTIQVNQAPTILSPNNVTFSVGTLQTFTITTSGTPTVNSIALTGCVLPAGLSFNYTSGATATISGTPTASGNVSCTVTASNGVAPAATQTLAVAVNQGPAAVADSYSTLVGTALNVSAPGLLQNDTLGNPLATLTSFGGNSLGGVVTDHAAGASVAFGTSGGTLTVNGDGSLGLTAPTAAGQYTFLYRIANGVSTSDAMVTINVNQSAAITSAASTTFIDGQANSFGVTTTGFPTPTLSIGTITPALAGVNFVDNGNGTGTLSGSPALGTAGTYTFTITAHNGIGADATQNFTLTVNEKPAITSASTTTFTVGTPGTFSVTTTGTPVPSIARGGVALPSGVTFTDNGNGTGTLAGTPAAGTGGSYAITFTATNSAGSTPAQTFTLIVNQSPAITSANNASFVIGQAGQTFTVTTTGFPTGASMAITQSPNPDNLPANVTFTNNNNGTATIAGTPASGTKGAYALTINANNGIAPAASQGFTFTVTCPVISLLPAASTFNANYNAAFSQGFTPSGGTAPYTYTLGGAALPSVAFSGNNLTGTPNNTGGFAFTVKATDANGCDSPVQSYTLNVFPVVTDDSYGNILGNVKVDSTTGSPFSVATNDQYPAAGTTISAFDASSAHSGTVTMTTSGGNLGQFTYDPPVGYSGTDSFTYTLTSNGLSKIGTVSFNVGSPTLWFVNDAVGACSSSCDGRESHPFTGVSTITNDGTATHPKASDSFFVYGGGAAYSGSLTLLANQKLIGQGAAATLATLTGLSPGVGQTLPATGGSAPVLTSAGVVLTVNTGNFIHGLTLGSGTTSLLGSAFGTLTVNDNVTIGTTGQAINLTNGTFNATFNNVTSSGGTNNVSLVQIAGTVNLGGGALSAATGTNFVIGTGAASSGGTADISYGGTITQTTNPQAVMVVQNRTGGSLTLSGLVNASVVAGVKGVSLLNNTGSTITFRGGLILNTGTNAAFTATGGGTVNVCDDNPCNPAATGALVNTLTTTTGTALTVSSTTIGANGLEFKSISANGGANGILLSNTGASGGLTVNGDGANVAVGGNASGGTIGNMAGADGTTSGVGVYLNNTKNVVLRRMAITGTNQNFGIRGFGVDGFTLQYSTVNGTNGTAHNALPDDAGEGSIYFGNTVTNGILTQGTFTNNAISGGFWDNMRIVNTAGTATMTLKGNTFGSNLVSVDANSSLVIEARGAGTVINSVVGGPGAGEPNTFTGAHADLANFTGQTGTMMDVQFKNNALSNNYVPNNVGGGSLNLSSQGVMTFVVDSNSMSGADGSAITLFKANAGTSYSGKLSNNTIGVAGVVDSASKSGNGIFLSAAGAGTIGLTIINNSIRNWHNNGGMYFDNTGGSYTANFTIQGNTVAEPGVGSFTDLAITDGGNLTSDTINVCAVIGGSSAAQKNSFSEVNPSTGDVYIGASGANGGHSFNLPGYAGGASLANVQTFVTGNNTLSGGSTVIAYDDNGAPIGGTFTGTGTSCPTPP